MARSKDIDWLPAEEQQKPKPEKGGANDKPEEKDFGGVGVMGQSLKITEFSNVISLYNMTKSRGFNLAHNQKIHDMYFSDRELQSDIAKVSWFGPNTELNKLKEGYLKFQAFELLQKLKTKMEGNIPPDLMAKVEKQKIKYNDRLGVFNFNRALVGMRRVKEYVDPDTNTVIDSKDVTLKNGEFIDTNSGKVVDQRNAHHPNGNPKVVTANKKVYGLIDKIKSQSVAVEIFMSTSMTYKEKAEDLIYNSLASVILAEKLVKAGVKVKITAVFPNYDSVVAADGKTRLKVSRYSVLFVGAKNWGETLDANAVALLTSDPRFYRYSLIKYLITYQDNLNERIAESIGGGVSAKATQTMLEKANFFKARNLTNTEYLFLGDVRSEQAAIDQFKQAIEQLENRVL